MDIDEKVGTSGNWNLLVSEKESITVSGMFLGMTSSQARRHAVGAHSDGLLGVPERRCSACRWSEFRIFREETGGLPVDDAPYIIHFTGRSSVVGETTRYRIEDVLTAQEVIEVLTTRRGGKAYLSAPAARVLAQAAAFDKRELQTAYDARRVA
jgi:hypothetical protein